MNDRATTFSCSAFGSAWKFFAIADFLAAEGGEGVSNLREAPRAVDKDDVVCESSWDTCAIGVDDEALFRHQSLDTLLDAQFWQRLCPFLTVTDAPLADDAEELAGDAPAHGRRQDLLSGDGFFRMTADEVAIPAHQAELLACGVRRLQAHGYPATAVLMYDEAWALLALLRRHVQGTCTSCATRRLDPLLNLYRYTISPCCSCPGASGNASIHDVFVFVVDAAAQGAGRYVPGPGSSFCLSPTSLSHLSLSLSGAS